MQLRRLTVMVLALGGLSLPVRAEDAIRLFEPVPAGKVVLAPPRGYTASSPPRALIVRAAPLMRGSLKEGEPAARSTAPAANAPWQVAPQTIPDIADRMAAPSPPAPSPSDEWQKVTPPPRVIRNAAR